jgi:predicted lipoprotein with Yx(FWY)xxD motif
VTPRIAAFPAVAAVTALALLAVGCGSDSSTGSGGGYGSSGGGTTKPAATSPNEAAATVAVASVPKLGPVIVDSKGSTLYDFHKDKGTKSSCYGECAKVWPPLLTGSEPQAAGAVSASKLGTTRRSDGTTQVTFGGHPLYTYVEDTKPGDVNGNDFSSFGAQWYALQPSGAEVED